MTRAYGQGLGTSNNIESNFSIMISKQAQDIIIVAFFLYDENKVQKLQDIFQSLLFV